MVDRAERRQRLERQMLTEAARLDFFTIDDVWKAVPGANYQHVARTLLEWWRDGLTLRKGRDGWRPYGQIRTNRFFPGPGRYKWREDETSGVQQDRGMVNT